MDSKDATQLRRVIGPWAAAAIVIGTVIGSGIFKKASTVTQGAPQFSVAIALWLFGGMITIFGSLALAEVAVRFPATGGNYIFLSNAYGRWAGFLWGWVEYWVIRSATIAAMASVFSETIANVLSNHSLPVPATTGQFWIRQSLSVTIIVAATIINSKTTKTGANVQIFITIAKVVSLVAIFTIPALAIILGNAHSAVVYRNNLAPIWPDSWHAVRFDRLGVPLVGVLWAYHGWMNIAPMAGEIRQPSRNIPLSLILGVSSVTILYLMVNIAYYLVLPRSVIVAAGNTSVAAAFCGRLFGTAGALAASIAVILSVLGTLNGNILVAPRLLYAMGSDGLISKKFTRLHARNGTPVFASTAVAIWSSLLVLGIGCLTRYQIPKIVIWTVPVDLNFPVDKSPFDVVTDFAVFGSIILEIMAVATIFKFRSMVHLERSAYRCPLFPFLPAFYILAMVGILFTMFSNRYQRVEAVTGCVFIAIGVLFYITIARHSSGREQNEEVKTGRC